MVVAKGVTLRVRITSSLEKGIEEAATRDRLSSPDWVRAVLARAVIQGAFGDWKVAAAYKGDRHGPKPKRKPAT
jgi:hypothetical protein